MEGTLFGPYEPLALLGTGGMGAVYLARHRQLGLQVAVKVMPLALSSTQAGSFQAEIEALATLSHPNIVQVFDAGVLQDPVGSLPIGTPWVAMERLGATLAERPPTPARMPAVIERVLEALGYAHGRGILHLDLKPSNLLWRGDEVVLADFGLARQAAGASAQDWCSVGFAPPEQQQGRASLLGPWTDLYALGVTVGHLCPTRNTRLVQWLEQATQPDLTKRFPSAAAAREALTGVAADHTAPTELEATRPSGAQAPAPAPSALPAPWFPVGPVERPASANRRTHRGAGLGLRRRREVPLFGRDAELASLWAALAEVLASRTPRWVRIEGVPGTGLSKLGRELSTQAHQATGARTLRIANDPEVPTSIAEQVRSTMGWRASDIASGALVLGHPLVQLWLGGTPLHQRRIPAALARWAELGQPTVIFVDDAQWMDPSTLVTLQQEVTGAVLVVCGFERGAAVPPLTWDTSLTLDRLSDASLREVLTTGLGLDSPTAFAIAHRASGNPELALALVDVAVANGSLVQAESGLRLVGTLTLPDAAIEPWITRLSAYADRARSSIELAAVLGHRFLPSELPDSDFVPTALRDGLWELDAGVLRWSHEAARSAVLAAAGPRAADLHRTCAAQIPLDVDPLRHGLHLAGSGQVDAAREALRRGFYQAMSSLDLARAQRAVDALTDLGSRAADAEAHQLVVLLARARLSWVQNCDAEADATLAEAKPLLDALGTPQQRLAYHLTLGNVRANQMRLHEALDAYAHIDPGTDPLVQAQLAHGVGRCLGWLGREHEALEVLTTAIHAVEHAGLDERLHDLLLVKATTLHTLGQLPEATALYERLLESRPILAYQAASNLADLHRQAGRFEPSQRAYTQARTLAEAAGAELSFAEICEPMLLARTDPDTCRSRLQQAIRASTSVAVQGFGHLGLLQVAQDPAQWATSWTAIFERLPRLPSDPDSIWFLERAIEHAARMGWLQQQQDAEAALTAHRAQIASP